MKKTAIVSNCSLNRVRLSPQSLGLYALVVNGRRWNGLCVKCCMVKCLVAKRPTVKWRQPNIVDPCQTVVN